ncbi:TonB-dependent receptor [Myxococcota bacterium]|nr:TonB-dependent receptor [Myxococcota bacterium]
MRPSCFAPRAMAASAIATGALFFVSSPLVRAEVVDPTTGSDAAATDDSPAPPPVVRRIGEVAITAARSKRELLDVPGNVTVIDRDTIERSGARDVPELLRREAGLFVTDGIGSPEGVRVDGRGFHNGGGNGSSLLILQDGRRLNEPDGTVMDWALVSLDRVERIEIVRGAASALYGDSANSGVVQILTKRGDGDGELTLRGRRGSYDTTTGSLFAGGSHGPLAGTLFVQDWDAENFRDRSNFESTSGAGTLRWTPSERASFELLAGLSQDDRIRPGTLTKSEARTLGRDAKAPGQDDNRDDVDETWIQAIATLMPHERATVKFVPYWREREDEAVVATPGFGGLSVFGTDGKTQAWGGSLQLELDAPIAGFAHRVLAGGELLREGVDDQQFFVSPFGIDATDVDLERRIWSFFAQDELNLTETLLLTTGLRFDTARYRGDATSVSDFGAPSTNVQPLDDDREKWSPRAALTWRFVPSTSAYFAYARGFRFANLDEAVGFTGQLFEIGPQESDTYEIGFKHRSDRLSANLTFFWMRVDDEILLNQEIDALFGASVGPSGQNANIDRTRHRGVELWFSWRPVTWLELYGSYTYDDAEVRKDTTSISFDGMGNPVLIDIEGKQLPLTPRHRGTVGGLVTVPWRWVDTELGANLNVVGERFGVNDLRNEFSKLDDYETLDLHATLRPHLSELGAFGKHVEVALTGRVRNALNHHYSEFAGERTFVRGAIGVNPSPDTNYELVLAVTVRR